jgi:hypothetical protein
MWQRRRKSALCVGELFRQEGGSNDFHLSTTDSSVHINCVVPPTAPIPRKSAIVSLPRASRINLRNDD